MDETKEVLGEKVRAEAIIQELISHILNDRCSGHRDVPKINGKLK